MLEIIDFEKITIGSCKFMQHAYFCKCICAHGYTRYIMSIIVSNCQHCDAQQFQTLSYVYTARFSQ